jgi:thiamine-phosphate pyrophosphorylase
LHLYYITDRKQFPGGEAEQRRRLVEKIAEAARARVDYIQLREKDLLARELEQLAREAVQAVRDSSSVTKLLINSRVDVALACGADGVHLTSTDISAGDALAIASCSTRMSGIRPFTIAVSTHSVAEVEFAYAQGAEVAVFGPVFEKVTVPTRAGFGIEELRRTCKKFAAHVSFSVYALGGITVENASTCIDAGAAGIAAIRLFQDNDVAEVVRRLRESAGQ